MEIEVIAHSSQTDESGLVTNYVTIREDDLNRLNAKSQDNDSLNDQLVSAIGQKNDLLQEIQQWKSRVQHLQSELTGMEHFAEHNYAQYNALWHQHAGYTTAFQHFANTLGAGMAYPPDSKLLMPVMSQRAAFDPKDRRPLAYQDESGVSRG